MTPLKRTPDAQTLADRTDQEVDVLKVVQTAASVLAPIAVVTGLLYYFGWIRTGAIFGHFGIDQNLLGYTTTEYLLRSAGVAFRPVAVLLLGAAALLALYHVLARLCAPDRRLGRGVLIAVLAVACLLFVVALGTMFGLGALTSPLLSAVLLVVGIAVAEAAASVQRSSAGGSAVLVRRILVVAIALVGCFWGFAVYAQSTGDGLADAWGSNVGTLPNVVVYSEKDLRLSGPGVAVTALPGEDGYRYRYSGLHLLIYSHERWFLLPEGWRPDGEATAIILTDSDGMRVELAPGG